MNESQAPEGFQEEVRRAEQENQPAKLILLGLDAQGSPWESAGRSLTERALLALGQGANSQLERVILFTGHRIDSAGRKIPRFPPDVESVARNAIWGAVVEQKEGTQGALLGIAGGANGGDILFHEVCGELEIETEMLLALPADQFIKASVESDDKNWVKRFDQQLAKHQNPPILSESPELPHWLEFKKNYDIWQRNNLWLLSQALSQGAEYRTLIALWDGETGDGPGGTEHMVSLAKAHDSQFVWLNTKELFGLADAASGAV
jgi:hypothetical protein